MNCVASIILFGFLNTFYSTASSDQYNLKNDSHFSQFCKNFICTNFTTDDLFVLISKSKIFDDKAIQFQDASIVKIPKKLFEVLPNLEILQANYCQLEYFGHSDFEKANKLQILNLDDNGLRYILEKNFYGANNLVSLSVERNEVIELAENAFYGLENLENLSLSGNSIIELRQNLLSFVPNLKSLNLSDNKIEYLDNFLLLNNTKLQIVDFSYNNIMVIQENTFSNIPLLIRLDLSKNSMNTITLNLQKVIYILADNNVVLESFEIRQGSTEILILHSNSIKNIFIARPADLEIVNLIQNNLNDISFLYFAFNLKQLHLAGNKLKRITRNDLKNLNKLEILNLQFNDILKIDPDALKSQKQLKYLDISYNNLESLYTDILINCPKIETFNFNGNFLGCKNLNYILLDVQSRNINYKRDQEIENLSQFNMINEIYCKRKEFIYLDDTAENLNNLKKEFDIILKYKQMKLRTIEKSLQLLKESII